MKKKNRNMLLAVGGIAAVVGLGYYFWKKNQEAVTTAGYTNGYLGATMLPGRTWPSPGIADHAAYRAGAFATGHR